MDVNQLQEVIDDESQKIMDSRGLHEKQEINNGYCQLLVRSVFDTVKIRYGSEYTTWSRESDKPTLIERTYGEYKMVDGSHAWIEFKGKHFDAERPEGVEDPSELPIFCRTRVKNPIDNQSV